MYKTKKLACVALVFTALSMAGCSSEAPAPIATETAAVEPRPEAPTEALYMPNEKAPAPDQAQSEKLLVDLGNISPSLNTPVSVDRSRAVCEDIIAGKSESELAQRVSAVFGSTADGPLSELQVADVLKVINESGFCKTAA